MDSDDEIQMSLFQTEDKEQTIETAKDKNGGNTKRVVKKPTLHDGIVIGDEYDTITNGKKHSKDVKKLINNNSTEIVTHHQRVKDDKGHWAKKPCDVEFVVDPDTLFLWLKATKIICEQEYNVFEKSGEKMIKQLSLFKKDANVKFVTINLYKSGTIMIQGLNTCVQWKEKFYNQIKAKVNKDEENHQTSNTDEITYTSDSASVNNQLDYDDKHDKAPSEQSDNFETRISKLENSIQGIDSTLCDINLKCSNIINSNGDIHTLKAEVAIIKKDLELLLPNIKDRLPGNETYAHSS
ncbi:hypothetical protein SNE40_001684 [Patella caerulea]|uniref:Uncharacterized protein n=1 Tax=Patella caerulea TaxID=87958 RepID=A0AAN8K4N0_PATCE